MRDRSRRALSHALLAIALGCGDSTQPEDEPDSETPEEPIRACKALRGFIGEPAPNGTPASSSFGPPHYSGPTLAIVPDAISATTWTGDVVSCGFGNGRWGCSDPRGLQSVTVRVDQQEITRTVPSECPVIVPEEDLVTLILDELTPCVRAGTIVLEGDLLNYDPNGGAPRVRLAGRSQTFDYLFGRSVTAVGRSDYIYEEPSVDCRVASGHYKCPTIGYRKTTKHRVLIDDSLTTKEVELPVDDCTVAPVSFDIRCPATPSGVQVQTPADQDVTVVASYEGGTRYPCAKSGSRFFCPPAPGEELGTGSYEFVATSSKPPKVYVARVSRLFDGCNMRSEPVLLTEQP